MFTIYSSNILIKKCPTKSTSPCTITACSSLPQSTGLYFIKPSLSLSPFSSSQRIVVLHTDKNWFCARDKFIFHHPQQSVSSLTRSILHTNKYIQQSHWTTKNVEWPARKSSVLHIFSIEIFTVFHLFLCCFFLSWAVHKHIQFLPNTKYTRWIPSAHTNRSHRSISAPNSSPNSCFGENGLYNHHRLLDKIIHSAAAAMVRSPMMWKIVFFFLCVRVCVCLLYCCCVFFFCSSWYFLVLWLANGNIILLLLLSLCWAFIAIATVPVAVVVVVFVDSISLLVRLLLLPSAHLCNTFVGVYWWRRGYKQQFYVFVYFASIFFLLSLFYIFRW